MTSFEDLTFCRSFIVETDQINNCLIFESIIVSYLSTLGVERGLLSQIRIHKLSYFGHIARHDSLQKTVLTGRIDGRRGRGRPRRQWYDDIKEWTGNELCTNIKLAQGRVTWRSVASRPKNGPQQPG